MMSINIPVWATNTQDGEPPGEVKQEEFYHVLSRLELNLRDRAVFCAVSPSARAINNDLEEVASKAAKREVQAIIDTGKQPKQQAKQIADVLINYGVGLDSITIEPKMKKIVQKELGDRFIEAIKALSAKELVDKAETKAIIAGALKVDPDIARREKCGRGFLHSAAANGDLDLAKNLIAWGSCVNACDSRYMTPLGSAILKGNLDIVILLLEQGAGVNLLVKLDLKGSDFMTPLDLAATNNRLGIVKLLIEHGAVVDGRHPTRGHTPLHSAATFGHLNIVKYLVECGANVNARNVFGRTPLCHAKMLDHASTVEFLISQGAQRGAQSDE